VVLRGVSPLDRAAPDTLAFAASRAWRDALQATAAGAVLLPPALADDGAQVPARIVVEDPARAMATVARAMFPPVPPAPGIDATTRIGRGTVLGADVTVAPGVTLGDHVRLGDRCCLGPGVVLGDFVEVGDDCHLDAHVVLYPHVRLGRMVRIKAGSVLGGEGFGFHSSAAGHERVPQVGGLVVGDAVEVGSGCTIDRGSVGDTEIGTGTKLDNHVHVGHNARIGAHCVLAGGVLVAGSAVLGDFVIAGGGCGVLNQVVVGSHVRIGAGTMVSREVPAGTAVSGFPGQPHRLALRAQAAALRLPAIIDELERIVASRERP